MPSTETALGIDARAEGERGEDGELVRGVEAADVEGRIGLGVAEPLRLGEADFERQSVGLHAREDVVAGAVQDAADAPHRVAGQALAQRLDDGNAAADRRLERQRCAAALGEPRQFEPMRGEHRLVGGDDGQAARQGRHDGLVSDPVRAADQFDEHVDFAVGRQFARIGEERRLRRDPGRDPASNAR